jgi:hypothetical protein
VCGKREGAMPLRVSKKYPCSFAANKLMKFLQVPFALHNGVGAVRQFMQVTVRFAMGEVVNWHNTAA